MSYTDRADIIAADAVALGYDATREIASLTTQLVAAKAQTLTDAATIARLEARIATLITTTPPPVVAPAPVGDRLSWTPPTLTTPTTILPADNAGKIVLLAGRDYIIKLPTDRAWRNTRGLHIEGGRNVVIIGGLVDVAAGWYSGGTGPGVMANGYVKRAAYFNGQTGTVHLEGVAFTSSTGSLSEGLNVSAPLARVQIQNVKLLAGVTGAKDANHGDALQSWNGPRWLGVDGFSAMTAYQGMFLNPHDLGSAPVDEGWVLRRVEIVGVGLAKYILWKVAPPQSLIVDRVFTSGGLGNYPNAAAWPGVVHSSSPAMKSYAAAAGFGYATYGYA